MSARAFMLVGVLCGLGCGSDDQGLSGNQSASLVGNPPASDAGSSTPAASGAPSAAAPSRVLTFPLPSTLDSTDRAGIVASGRLSIAAHATVHPSENGATPIASALGGGNSVTVAAHAQVQDVHAIGSVHVGAHGRVGDVLATTTVQLAGHASSGQVTQGVSIAPTSIHHTIQLPLESFASPGIQNGATVVLPPGRYPNVNVPNHARVRLSTGTYEIQQLSLQVNGTIEIDTSLGPVVVVAGRITQLSGAISATPESAEKILWYSDSNQAIEIRSDFKGTLLAPNASVDVAAHATIRGAIFARQINIGAHAAVYHVPYAAFGIVRIDIANDAPCVSESTRITVVTTEEQSDAVVTIGGVPGVVRDITYFAPGEHQVQVSLFTADRQAYGHTISLRPQACDDELFAVLGATLSRTTPYVVRFAVLSEHPGSDVRYEWDFGDGSAHETDVPYVEHSYVGSLDATTDHLEFDVRVTVQNGVSSLSTTKRIRMLNHYASTRSRGYSRAPVQATARMLRENGSLVGAFSVRNPEAESATYSVTSLVGHACDPDIDPVAIPVDGETWGLDGIHPSTSVTFAPGETRTLSLRVSRRTLDARFCGATLNLEGETSSGVELRMSAHFDTEEESMLSQPVQDQDRVELLNSVAASGWTGDPNVITEEDLDRLWLERRIPRVEDHTVPTTSVLPSGSAYLGARCDNGATPPLDGITCQATDEWRVGAPYLRNALKGDVFIVASCGTIGRLLRATLPRQEYTHEAIMTTNYYDLAHSTASDESIISTLGSLGIDTISENALRFAWPGALARSVDQAFNGNTEYNERDEEYYVVSGFSPSWSRCSGDPALNPPLLFRPAPGSPTTARARLQEAGDFARHDRAHYRWFGYTRGNIALDPAFDDTTLTDRGPATVSTTFIWRTLRLGPATPIVLEGVGEVSDINPVRPGHPWHSDGLYWYSPAERLQAAHTIFNGTYSLVKNEHWEANEDNFLLGAQYLLAPLPLPGFQEFSTSQARRIANQFTNCFGFDECDGSIGGARDWRDPGDGYTVSPDDFRNWDSTTTPGGVFGDEEVVLYRPVEYRRVFRWAASQGASMVRGTVELEDGTPVVDAIVTLAGQSTTTAADGAFAFDPIASGSYVADAGKLVLVANHAQRCPPDEPTANCIFLSDRQPVVLDGSDRVLRLVLRTQDGTVPPELTARPVFVSGHLHVKDDDVRGEDTADLPFGFTCDLGPTNPSETHSVRACAGGEVVVIVDVLCSLHDGEISVILSSTLYEGGRVISPCSTQGDELNGRASETFHIPFCTANDGASCTEYTLEQEVRNTDDVFGGDYGRTVLRVQSFNPNLPDESFRIGRLSFEGDVTDDEVFGTETAVVDRTIDCYVDPFNRTDSVFMETCAGNEANLVISGQCELMNDEESIHVRDLRFGLYEGRSCNTTDLGGEQVRSFVLPPCSGTCTPTNFDVQVDNTERRGGDRAILNVTATNEQNL